MTGELEVRETIRYCRGYEELLSFVFLIRISCCMTASGHKRKQRIVGWSRGFPAALNCNLPSVPADPQNRINAISLRFNIPLSRPKRNKPQNTRRLVNAGKKSHGNCDEHVWVI